MIDKLNITIENKLTKKIEYRLNLDNDVWDKFEYNTTLRQVYYEHSGGFYYNYEYDSKGNIIYFKDSRGFSNGIIRDDR
jgi:hypothetical protein